MTEVQVNMCVDKIKWFIKNRMKTLDKCTPGTSTGGNQWESVEKRQTRTWARTISSQCGMLGEERALKTIFTQTELL